MRKKAESLSDSKNKIKAKKERQPAGSILRTAFYLSEAVVYFEIYYAAKYGFNVVNML